MFAWESQHISLRWGRYCGYFVCTNVVVLIVERFFGGLPTESSFWASSIIHIILWIWIQLYIIIYILFIYVYWSIYSTQWTKYVREWWWWWCISPILHRYSKVFTHKYSLLLNLVLIIYCIYDKVIVTEFTFYVHCTLVFFL